MRWTLKEGEATGPWTLKEGEATGPWTLKEGEATGPWTLKEGEERGLQGPGSSKDGRLFSDARSAFKMYVWEFHLKCIYMLQPRPGRVAAGRRPDFSNCI